MPKSISILSFAAAAALGLTGAAFAQDTTEEPAAESTAETSTETSTDAAADTATETGTATEADTDADADTDAAAPAEGAADGTGNAFSTGTQVTDEQPAVYVKEKFGDWSLRCFRNDEGEDPCQLYQLLREAGGNPIAEFSVFRIEGQAPAVAGATAIVPLVTLLTEELKLSVDGATAKSYPYRVCTEAGCVAQMGLTQEDVDTFKRGATAQITLVPAQAPDQKVRIDVSLAGFTAGYEAVGEFTE
ncbi:invasion associated locus B family protein [Roseovarius sp. S1116L3]|uniref:invasion associated locus B family protein n=1 Tax=Roseovarius roseus TaxID=3342636 RepID=UPI003727C409